MLLNLRGIADYTVALANGLLNAGTIGAGTTGAVERLSAPMLDDFWVHLDADVLDDAVMPAVDYRMAEGLSWEELAATLRASIATSRVVGIDVTIFNPKLDGDGAIRRAFVDTLANGLNP